MLKATVGHFRSSRAVGSRKLKPRLRLSRDVLTMSISLIGTIDITCIEILTLHGGPEKKKNTKKQYNLEKVV